MQLKVDKIYNSPIVNAIN